MTSEHAFPPDPNRPVDPTPSDKNNPQPAGDRPSDSEKPPSPTPSSFSGTEPPVVEPSSRVASTSSRQDSGTQHRDNRSEAAQPQTPSAPSRGLLEIILDPGSLQWLMGIGGLLMVVGLVILLWINEYLTPPIMALSLGFGNLGVLALGFYTLRFSDKKLVGQALTLLSCLVMPLNLWYYSANHLVTIDGHLWVPAVIICVVYAAAAVMLKDKLFVYIFSAGVTLTGLLMIADLPPSPSMFWEIRLPSVFLILVGLASIHAERVFTAASGAFSRKEFGSAFFWAGHVQMAGGLLLILGAQVAGDWFYDSIFREVYLRLNATPSPMCGELRWLALALVGFATYGYLYSDLLIRRSGWFVHVAAFTAIWAEILIVQELNWELGTTALIVVLAVTSIVVNIAQYFVVPAIKDSSNPSRVPGSQLSGKHLQALPTIGLILGCLPISVGVWEYWNSIGLGALNGIGGKFQVASMHWAFVGAMISTAIALRLGAQVYRESSQLLRKSYFAGAATSLTIAMSSALALLGLQTFAYQVPWLMLLALGYLAASRFYGSSPDAKPALWVAHNIAIFLLPISVIAASVHWIQGTPSLLNWTWALVFAEGALFYAVLATKRQPEWLLASTVFGVLSGCQLFSFFGAGTGTYILSLATFGLLILIAGQTYFRKRSRFVATEFGVAKPRTTNSEVQDSVVVYFGHTILSLALLASVFFGLFQTLAYLDGRLLQLDWSFTFNNLLAILLAGAAIVLSPKSGLRGWYWMTVSAHVLLIAFGAYQMVTLSTWQKVEVFVLVAGFGLLLVGHIGWYREQRMGSAAARVAQDEYVGNCLAFGALLSSVPLALATWLHRFQGDFVLLDEFGFLFVSVLLLTLGLMLKVRSTTIVGSGMTALYFVTFVVLVPWGQLNTLATGVLSGGALMFGAGLLLAFYREQILALPEMIRQRQGVFRVLDWR